MNIPPTDPLRVVATAPPELPEALAGAILGDYWRLEGKLTPLVSERDQNYRIDTADGRRYVLKIANKAEDQVVTLFQIEALRYIEGRAGTEPPSVPKVVPTPAGETHVRIQHESDSHIVRLVSWVEGEPPGAAAPGEALCRSVGRGLARLGRRLHGFSHAGENQSLLWDMKRAGGLRSHLRLVDADDVRSAVGAALDDFESIAMPAMQSMRWQVIHNDLHPDNFLVGHGRADEMIGVIDFGDMLRSPLIVDLGVCAAYLHGGESTPFGAIGAFVAGYQQVTPLTAAELDVLYYLVRARLAATICISNWRRSARGAGDLYLQSVEQAERAAAGFLLRVNRFTKDAFLEQIGSA